MMFWIMCIIHDLWKGRLLTHLHDCRCLFRLTLSRQFSVFHELTDMQFFILLVFSSYCSECIKCPIHSYTTFCSIIVVLRVLTSLINDQRLHVEIRETTMWSEPFSLSSHNKMGGTRRDYIVICWVT